MPEDSERRKEPRGEERVHIPLDPEDALRALLLLDPTDPDSEDDDSRD